MIDGIEDWTEDYFLSGQWAFGETPIEGCLADLFNVEMNSSTYKDSYELINILHGKYKVIIKPKDNE